MKLKMATRKQPDRQVKKKRKLETSENLDITKKKHKLVEPGVEMKFKMATRKQPDRQVKKKCKLEMSKNLDIRKTKRKLELEETRNFDIIGTLICNYGMTGENLVRQIFSYMDFSSIQGGHLVCKTWNLFLVNDKRLWLDIFKQTHPYFEFVSKQLLSDGNFNSVLPRNILERYFGYVEKSDEYSCREIIQIFKRIQMIHIVLQDVIQDCPIYEVFQTKFIGKKLAEEIQLQIDKGQLISNFLLVSSKIDQKNNF